MSLMQTQHERLEELQLMEEKQKGKQSNVDQSEGCDITRGVIDGERIHATGSDVLVTFDLRGCKPGL